MLHPLVMLVEIRSQGRNLGGHIDATALGRGDMNLIGLSGAFGAGDRHRLDPDCDEQGQRGSGTKDRPFHWRSRGGHRL